MLNLKKIISKKKYRFLYVIFFLLLFNSFLEAISIGILLPFLSFTFNDAGNQNINEYFEFILNFFNLESSSLSFLYILFGIYVFKYIYIFWYSRIQANYLGNLKTELQMRMYGGYLDQPFQFHTNINSSVLIRNITSENTVALFCSLTFSLTVLNRSLYSCSHPSYTTTGEKFI